MTTQVWLSLAVLVVSVASLGLTLILYPGIMILLGWRHPPDSTDVKTGELPKVSVLIVARNAEALLATKLANTLALDYPSDRLQIIAFSDGSTDGTATVIEQFAQEGIKGLISISHVGKFEGINQGAAVCDGEILVFSDADALLAPDALRQLLRPLADPLVGGVCGQQVINNDFVALSQPQRHYIHFDSLIKQGESRLGRITSNTGALYAIRRILFRPVPPGVTDDLFQSLAVIGQDAQFLFEPRARALLRASSRDTRHELIRRRRIVARSLRAIWLNRQLLNPCRYGIYAIGLLINKVLRRCLPVLLLALLVSTLDLARVDSRFWWLLGPQLAGYGLAAAHPLLAHLPGVPRQIAGLSVTAWYFVIGNLGTLFGGWDFLRGRQLVKWDPQ